MSYLKITEYDRSLEVDELLYENLKNRLYSFLGISGVYIIFWLLETRDLTSTLIIILCVLIACLAYPIRDLFKFGSKKRICQITSDEIIVSNDIKISINDISAIGFLKKKFPYGFMCIKHYDIDLLLQNKTHQEMLVSITSKELMVVHNAIKHILDVPCVYKEANTFTEDQFHERIEDLL